MNRENERCQTLNFCVKRNNTLKRFNQAVDAIKKTKVEQLIMIKHPYNVPLTEQCIRLLAHRHISSKDELKHELIQLGFLDISLSSISFMLIGIGAKKVTDTNGRKYYCLREPRSNGTKPRSKI
ncbi:hypothetical protein Q8W15_16890 [Photobacterium damselae subsp. piscicida]|uniref:Uncharacterized protein n=1 Tax=Photobacterium damsela subsp. piscicida TaxID=38294 RepID=A0A5F0YJ39_PHODP|nr:hypothetical protein [Photobacterium damselae]MBE8127861.1 hypothetical protein [Photobacterium damselae subsp. piscicida]MDP2531994.1 hypothetical protein [Photobacterium damselae subsp. piscicida]MDP2534162.1 hypothetical protein [Photobacterium damselae subsp. piscicida]MDP2543131.1 hypothetical protein [Photobacterium damselae subsp. piscicida]MDP2558507.1 hypothetical protein [Photobacterium damselae subsp. piscicida]